MEFEQPTWGRVTAEEMRSIVVLSPHFDDAVMGAGQMLLRHAGQSVRTVITVLGGRPPAYPDPVSPWDALGGFQSGDDVVAVRREEDRAAMAVIGATPVWLEFPDHQYLAPEDRPTPEQVAPAMEDAILAAGADGRVRAHGDRQPGPRHDPRRRPDRAGPPPRAVLVLL